MSCAELWKPSPSWQKIDSLYTMYCKWQHVERAITQAKRNSVTSHITSTMCLRCKETFWFLYLLSLEYTVLDQRRKVRLLQSLSGTLWLWVHRLESSEILSLIHVGFLLMWWKYIMGRVRNDSVFRGSSKASKQSKCSGSLRWQTLWIIVILALKLYYF